MHLLPESFSPSCHLHRSDGKKICYHDMSWLTWNIYQCLGQLGEVAWRKMFLIDLALVINSRFYIEDLNSAFNFNFSSLCLYLSLLRYFHSSFWTFAQTWINQVERNSVSDIVKTISEVFNEDNCNSEFHVGNKESNRDGTSPSS